jgi:hypothetical protein
MARKNGKKNNTSYKYVLKKHTKKLLLICGTISKESGEYH